MTFLVRGDNCKLARKHRVFQPKRVFPLLKCHFRSSLSDLVNLPTVDILYFNNTILLHCNDCLGKVPTWYIRYTCSINSNTVLVVKK